MVGETQNLEAISRTLSGLVRYIDASSLQAASPILLGLPTFLSNLKSDALTDVNATPLLYTSLHFLTPAFAANLRSRAAYKCVFQNSRNSG